MSHEPTPDPLAAAVEWRRAGEVVAVATVIETWGSAPRRPGSKLVVNGRGDFLGSVSGGCVEAAVIEEAADVLDGGEPRLLEYGVTDERAWEVGLACGGTVKVWLESLPEVYDDLQAARAQNRPVALSTPLEPGGGHRLDSGGDVTESSGLAEPVATVLESDRATVVEDGDHRWFVEPFNRPVRLVIVGAVHIAQALAPMASIAGFEVVIVDPRERFANEARFAGVEYRTGWPGPELSALGVDSRTAIVSLTHDPKIDDPALTTALSSPAFYIGALGSRKTMAARLERLREQGFSEADRGRIRGPVGLDIGARNPPEIAVAILSQVIAALNRRDLGR